MSIDLSNQLLAKGWVSKGEEEERVGGEYKGMLNFPSISTLRPILKKNQ